MATTQQSQEPNAVQQEIEQGAQENTSRHPEQYAVRETHSLQGPPW